jgi:bifunctional non-homologous end joining protein LigD
LAAKEEVWRSLRSLARKESLAIQFYAFDLLIHRERSLLKVPLDSRREMLEKALEKVVYPVIFSRTFNAEPAELIRAAKELQLEGIIAKRKDSYYEPGNATAPG